MKLSKLLIALTLCLIPAFLASLTVPDTALMQYGIETARIVHVVPGITDNVSDLLKESYYFVVFRSEDSVTPKEPANDHEPFIQFVHEEASALSHLEVFLNGLGSKMNEVHKQTRRWKVTVAPEQSAFYLALDLSKDTLYVRAEYLSMMQDFDALLRTKENGLQCIVEKLFEKDNWVPTKAEDFYRIPLQFAHVLGESLWWCITCTVVLSITLPFVFNYGLGKLAMLICDVYQLDPTTCIDLVMAALGLAYLLIFPAAFVILKVCGLEHCKQKTVQLGGVIGEFVAKSMQ